MILFDIGDTITEIGRVSHVDSARLDTDCRVLTTDDVPEDSELWWMANEPSIQFQLCGADDNGGYGNSYCETIPVEEIRYWFGDESLGDDVITTLGAGPDDRFEICYPDDNYQEQIRRSLVANDVLWTMSPADLQANDLDSLAPLVTIRAALAVGRGRRQRCAVSVSGVSGCRGGVLGDALVKALSVEHRVGQHHST